MDLKVTGMSGQNIVEEQSIDAGVWGGECLCPDGETFQVGDQGNCE
jgi:hypothetical protein